MNLKIIIFKFIFLSLTFLNVVCFHNFNIIRSRNNLKRNFLLSLVHSGTESVNEFNENRLQPSKDNEDGFFTNKEKKQGQIDLLYDSECPICMMEVNFLQKRDIYNRIKFTDLSSPQYIPEEHGNVQFADGMRKLRAVLPDGQVVVGVEVFRQTYDAIGLGWVFQLTRLPIIGQFADAVYDLWAENRLFITGRSDLAELLKERAAKLDGLEEVVSCDSDACGIDYDDLDDDPVSTR